MALLHQKKNINSSENRDEKTTLLSFNDWGIKDIDYEIVTYPMDMPTKSKGENYLWLPY